MVELFQDGGRNKMASSSVGVLHVVTGIMERE